jgi:hypothetical protein
VPAVVQRLQWAAGGGWGAEVRPAARAEARGRPQLRHAGEKKESSAGDARYFRTPRRTSAAGLRKFSMVEQARHRSRFAVAAARPGGTPPRKDRGTNTGTRRGHRKVSWVRMSQHSRIPPRRGALSVVHESLKYRQLAAARGAVRRERGGGEHASGGGSGRASLQRRKAT